MKRKNIVRIAAFIFIAVLLLLIGHFFIHGLEKEHGHCLLCELLTIGFLCTALYELLLLFLFVAGIPQITLIQLSLLSHIQIRLRAPPFYSNL
jgi:hypothetical protein